MATQNSKRETTKLNLSTEWMELESDPGLFTLLLEDIGVKGVKVEEVYDVTQTFEEPVYGYVFLFQWVEERRVRKKAAMNDECYITEASVLRRMFFAHQIVANSCATHALLSIMLNCEEKEGGLSLGHTLRQLKQDCMFLDPESRGYAIGNTPQLAVAHNQHAKPSIDLPTAPTSKRGSYVTTLPGLVPDTYHFVSYVPIGDRLFELDGLKQWPIDHGPWADTEDWTDLFKRIISKRLADGDGIQFNLMALIPDPLPRISQELQTLQTKQKILLDDIFKLAEQKLTVSSCRNSENGDHQSTTVDRTLITELVQQIAESMNAEAIALDDEQPSAIKHTKDVDSQLKECISQAKTVNNKLEACKKQYQDETETRKRFKVDAQRRTYDYDPFFEEYFKTLAVHKLLPPRMMEVKKAAGRRGKKAGKVKNKRGGRNKANT